MEPLQWNFASAVYIPPVLYSIYHFRVCFENVPNSAKKGGKTWLILDFITGFYPTCELSLSTNQQTGSQGDWKMRAWFLNYLGTGSLIILRTEMQGIKDDYFPNKCCLPFLWADSDQIMSLNLLWAQFLRAEEVLSCSSYFIMRISRKQVQPKITRK